MGLTPLQPLQPLTAPSFTGGVGSAVESAAKIAANVGTSGLSLIFGVNPARLVAIVLGLIIVAAAVFSFRPVRETVVGVTKDAAKVAAA